MNGPENRPAPPAAIGVHIETLVVDGLAVRHAGHLGAAVENELRTLLAENGPGRFASAATPGAQLEIAALRAPAIRTSRSPHAADAGKKIARAIYGGLRP